MKNFKESLLLDIEKQCSSIYMLNSPDSKYYLFTPTENGEEIERGMFWIWDEPEKFGYAYSFNLKTKKVISI